MSHHLDLLWLLSSDPHGFFTSLKLYLLRLLLIRRCISTSFSLSLSKRMVLNASAGSDRAHNADSTLNLRSFNCSKELRKLSGLSAGLLI